MPADLAVHLGELVVLALLTYVGTKMDSRLKDIKLSQAQDKAELLAGQNSMRIELTKSQTDMRMDLDQKHAENQRGLAVHLAEDTQRFTSIGETLKRMDDTLKLIRNGNR